MMMTKPLMDYEDAQDLLEPVASRAAQLCLVNDIRDTSDRTEVSILSLLVSYMTFDTIHREILHKNVLRYWCLGHGVSTV